MLEEFEREEKRRIFNKPFWKGFYIGGAVFTALNIAAYFYAVYEYEKYLSQPINFAPARRFMWGFPLWWDGYNFSEYPDGALNILVLFAFCFIFGIFFRYIAGRRLKETDQ